MVEGWRVWEGWEGGGGTARWWRDRRVLEGWRGC